LNKAVRPSAVVSTPAKSNVLVSACATHGTHHTRRQLNVVPKLNFISPPVSPLTW